MSWRIIKSKAAKADLVDIWLYSAPENLEAADRQISRIEKAVDRLSGYPRSGPARHDIGPDIRAIVINRYLVLYRILVNEKQVELLRVVDGRRDLALLFSGGES
ncbi:MAG: type II toxin-antitoxin system RelE/ParE family toxin [Sphingopyxis sp.]